LQTSGGSFDACELFIAKDISGYGSADIVIVFLQTFYGQGERNQFLQFCAVVFYGQYGQPLKKVIIKIEFQTKVSVQAGNETCRVIQKR